MLLSDENNSLSHGSCCVMSKFMSLHECPCSVANKHKKQKLKTKIDLKFIEIIPDWIVEFIVVVVAAAAFPY